MFKSNMISPSGDHVIKSDVFILDTFLSVHVWAQKWGIDNKTEALSLKAIWINSFVQLNINNNI